MRATTGLLPSAARASLRVASPCLLRALVGPRAGVPPWRPHRPAAPACLQAGVRPWRPRHPVALACLQAGVPPWRPRRPVAPACLQAGVPPWQPRQLVAPASAAVVAAVRACLPGFLQAAVRVVLAVHAALVPLPAAGVAAAWPPAPRAASFRFPAAGRVGLGELHARQAARVGHPAMAAWVARLATAARVAPARRVLAAAGLRGCLRRERG